MGDRQFRAINAVGAAIILVAATVPPVALNNASWPGTSAHVVAPATRYADVTGTTAGRTHSDASPAATSWVRATTREAIGDNMPCQWT